MITFAESKEVFGYEQNIYKIYHLKWRCCSYNTNFHEKHPLGFSFIMPIRKNMALICITAFSTFEKSPSLFYNGNNSINFQTYLNGFFKKNRDNFFFVVILKILFFTF